MLLGIFQSLSYGTFVLVTVIAYLFIRNIYNDREDRQIYKIGGRAPNKPGILPFGLGPALQTIRSFVNNTIFDYLEDLLARHGNPHTFEFYIGTQRIIFTRDHANIQAILATKFDNFGKGEGFNKDWHDFLGDSIFTTDNELWQRSRKLIRDQFSRTRLSDLTKFENHSQILLPMLQGNDEAEHVVDVLDLFFRYTLDVSTDFLFGHSANSMGQAKVMFAEAFDDVQRLQSIYARIGAFAKIMPRGHFYKQLKVLNNFVEPYIERALALSDEELDEREKSDEGYTFLHALAAHDKDRKFLRDQLVAVLLAGRDTTASALSWLFYELSKQPAIVEKLRSEILQVIGSTESPTFANLQKMNYTRHCINETLRLYPSVPFNVRFALRDTSLPQGSGKDWTEPIGVPKNTPVGYSTLLLQRRRDIYPTDKDFPEISKFVPERWEGKWTPAPWTYIPFNGGPRICVGQQFAMTEISYTVIRIFQQYSKIENCMAKPAEMKSDIVLHPAQPILLRFIRVGDEE